MAELTIHRVTLAAQINGTRTAVPMPEGPGIYLVRSFRVARTAGAAVGNYQPRIYDAAAGTEIDSLAYQHLTAFAPGTMAVYPQDSLNAAMPMGGRYVRTDTAGNIYVDANQSGGSVDTFKWILYVEKAGFYDP